MSGLSQSGSSPDSQRRRWEKLGAVVAGCGSVKRAFRAGEKRPYRQANWSNWTQGLSGKSMAQVWTELDAPLARICGAEKSSPALYFGKSTVDPRLLGEHSHRKNNP